MNDIRIKLYFFPMSSCLCEKRYGEQWHHLITKNPSEHCKLVTGSDMSRSPLVHTVTKRYPWCWLNPSDDTSNKTLCELAWVLKLDLHGTRVSTLTLVALVSHDINVIIYCSEWPVEQDKWETSEDKQIQCDTNEKKKKKLKINK